MIDYIIINQTIIWEDNHYAKALDKIFHSTMSCITNYLCKFSKENRPIVWLYCSNWYFAYKDHAANFTKAPLRDVHIKKESGFDDYLKINNNIETLKELLPMCKYKLSILLLSYYALPTVATCYNIDVKHCKAFHQQILRRVEKEIDLSHLTTESREVLIAKIFVFHTSMLFQHLRTTKAQQAQRRLLS